MRCPRCGSYNVVIETFTESETKHRGCLGWFFWILLACLTLGLILIIPLITNSKTKSRTRVMAVCQTCGKHWRL